MNWDLFFKVTTVATVSISIAVLVFAWLIPKRIYKRQMFSELLAEYRSAEMGVAIQKIWSFAEQCYISGKQMDEEYVRIFRLDQMRCSTVREWQSTLHYYRRKVSQFYQQLAGLGFWFLRGKARKNLSTGAFRIIHTAFKLEMHAVPEIFQPLCDDQIESALPPKLLPQIRKIYISRN